MAFFDSRCLRFNDICLKCGSVYTVLWVYVRDTTIYVGIFIAFKCIFFSSSIGLPLEGN